MDTNVTEITVTVDGISENITNVIPSLQGGITLLPVLTKHLRVHGIGLSVQERTLRLL